MIPRVGDIITGAVLGNRREEIEQFPHLAIAVTAYDTEKIAKVVILHDDYKITFVIIGNGETAGNMTLAGNSMAMQNTLRRRVYTIADLLATGC